MGWMLAGGCLGLAAFGAVWFVVAVIVWVVV